MDSDMVEAHRLPAKAAVRMNIQWPIGGSGRVEERVG